MGIEPTYPAWKAGVLPLNYTRATFELYQSKALFVNNLGSGIQLDLRKISERQHIMTRAL